MINKFQNWKRMNENKSNFNSLIDYTYLNDKSDVDNIKKVCNDAKEHNYFSVCVLPEKVSTAQAFLDDSDVQICTVISFPEGTDSTNNKIKETQNAITNGADEIDMVMDFKSLKELSTEQGEDYQKKYDIILDDIRSVVKVCHSDGIIIKVIIEIEELNYNQIQIACEMCVEAGADFVKTSTGKSKKMIDFNEKLEKIKYMRKILPDYMKIKISGGIRNIEHINDVLPYVDRIGTSIIIDENIK